MAGYFYESRRILKSLQAIYYPTNSKPIQKEKISEKNIYKFRQLRDARAQTWSMAGYSYSSQSYSRDIFYKLDNNTVLIR